MTTKNEMDWTTNLYVYNRCRKVYLEKKGEIHCSYCGYHKHENSTGKYYYKGIPARYSSWKKDGGSRYPNWKLCSKNGRQWMKKPLLFEPHHSKWHKQEYAWGVEKEPVWFDIKW